VNKKRHSSRKQKPKGIRMQTWKWLAGASAIALSLAVGATAHAEVAIDDVVKDASTPGDVVSATAR
jgi:hypothetical protein